MHISRFLLISYEILLLTYQPGKVLLSDFQMDLKSMGVEISAEGDDFLFSLIISEALKLFNGVIMFHSGESFMRRIR